VENIVNENDWQNSLDTHADMLFMIRQQLGGGETRKLA
jgi:hypothetical protein